MNTNATVNLQLLMKATRQLPHPHECIEKTYRVMVETRLEQLKFQYEPIGGPEVNNSVIVMIAVMFKKVYYNINGRESIEWEMVVPT